MILAAGERTEGVQRTGFPDSLALVEGAHRSSMDELAVWTREADRVIVFRSSTSAESLGQCPSAQFSEGCTRTCAIRY